VISSIADDLAIIDEAWGALQAKADALRWNHVETSRVRNQVTALLVKPTSTDLADAAATMMALAVERDKLMELIKAAADRIRCQGGIRP
jgi:hypothetical protein